MTISNQHSDFSESRVYFDAAIHIVRLSDFTLSPIHKVEPPKNKTRRTWKSVRGALSPICADQLLKQSNNLLGNWPLKSTFPSITKCLASASIVDHSKSGSLTNFT